MSPSYPDHDEEYPQGENGPYDGLMAWRVTPTGEPEPFPEPVRQLVDFGGLSRVDLQTNLEDEVLVTMTVKQARELADLKRGQSHSVTETDSGGIHSVELTDEEIDRMGKTDEKAKFAELNAGLLARVFASSIFLAFSVMLVGLLILGIITIWGAIF